MHKHSITKTDSKPFRRKTLYFRPDNALTASHIHKANHLDFTIRSEVMGFRFQLHGSNNGLA